ncbi:MAG: sodium:solute symporter family protein [Actinomycetota bacterium]|nr:sodium:solute symporter family protein [Actinomycetota bacterium]
MSVWLVWMAVIIYIVIATAVAFLARGKGRSFTGMADYFLWNRSMSGVLAALSYAATTYSAFMLVGLAGLTYAGGVGALGFEMVYFSGLILVAFFGPRFLLAGKKFGYVTPPEMLGDRYGSRAVAMVTALASCVFLIPYSAVQLAGIGYLLQGTTEGGISFTVGIVLATALAVIFTLVAGIRSVAWTDALQMVIMIFTASVAVLLVINSLGGFDELFGRLSSEHPGWLSVPGGGYFSFSVFLGLTLPWFFFSLSNPQVSQRLFMLGSMRNLRRMILGFLILGFFYTLVAVLWGFAALVRFPDLESADLASPALLGSDLVHPVVAVIMIVGIFAAAITTIDSILLTLSSMVSRDVYGARADVNESRQLTVGKLVIPLIAVLALLFAGLQLDLIAVLAVSSSAGLLVTVPALVGAFFWRRGTAAGVLASIIGGGLLVAYLEVAGVTPLGQASGVWGLPVSVILYIGVSLVTRAPQAKAAEFIDYLRGELKDRGAV